jgi:hypothetical protein
MLQNKMQGEILAVYRNKNGNSLAEFGPALWIFFLVILFPLFNLLQFICGVATVALIAAQSAQAMASAPDFNSGLTAGRAAATALAASGFGKFAHLTAVSPYGVNFYIDTTNVNTNTQTVTGPDTPLSTAIDTTNNLYQIEARCLYNVGPMIQMQGVIFLADIPLIGKPAQLSFSNQKAAEFPNGLSTVNTVP